MLNFEHKLTLDNALENVPVAANYAETTLNRSSQKNICLHSVLYNESVLCWKEIGNVALSRGFDLDRIYFLQIYIVLYRLSSLNARLTVTIYDVGTVTSKAS